MFPNKNHQFWVPPWLWKPLYTWFSWEISNDRNDRNDWNRKVFFSPNLGLSVVAFPWKTNDKLLDGFQPFFTGSTKRNRTFAQLQLLGIGVRILDEWISKAIFSSWSHRDGSSVPAFLGVDFRFAGIFGEVSAWFFCGPKMSRGIGGIELTWMNNKIFLGHIDPFSPFFHWKLFTTWKKKWHQHWVVWYPCFYLENHETLWSWASKATKIPEISISATVNTPH